MRIFSLCESPERLPASIASFAEHLVLFLMKVGSLEFLLLPTLVELLEISVRLKYLKRLTTNFRK